MDDDVIDDIEDTEDTEDIDDAVDDDDFADELLDCDEVVDDSDELPENAATLELGLNACLPPPPHAATDRLTIPKAVMVRIFISVIIQCQIDCLCIGRHRVSQIVG
jgi:hypothetical protein